jgi:hypothetical protein
MGSSAATPSDYFLRGERERRASNSPTDLIFSHNTLEILGFAFDTVPNTSVRFDREVRNDSVDNPFAIIGAPLWSLSLMMNIVIYRKDVGHGVPI